MHTQRTNTPYNYNDFNIVYEFMIFTAADRVQIELSAVGRARFPRTKIIAFRVLIYAAI